MPLLAIDKLTMAFGGLTAVREFDLAVERGEIDSIIGPNGAGKTTVFNALTGIYEPTAGKFSLEGRELARTFTWREIVVCVLVGFMTGLAGLLLALNVGLLWRATIKRNYLDRNAPFSYAAAFRSARDYWRGELALERTRTGRWQVVSARGKTLPPSHETRKAAEQFRQRLPRFEAGNLASVAVTRLAPNQWSLHAAKQPPETGAVLPSRSSAEARLGDLFRIAQETRSMQRWAIASFFAGAVLGAAAVYSLWRQTRRTPDVIAKGGVARTFQNIRLFENMTVQENVLVGMDRRFPTSLLGMIFRTPNMRRAEREARQAAAELLEFVGLTEKQSLLAKNLAYGEQRRLEIARALACQPKLLLLDEPAAGMNPTESHDLMHLIRQIRERGVTVVLIEHHMKLVMDISDRIAVLDHGLKIAEGTPAEVRANPQVIEAYLGKEDDH